MAIEQGKAVQGVGEDRDEQMIWIFYVTDSLGENTNTTMQNASPNVLPIFKLTWFF